MSAWIQDVVVSMVAVAAAFVLVYRTRATFTSGPSGSACSSCPSSRCGSKQPQPATAATRFPLHVIRPTSAR